MRHELKDIFIFNFCVLISVLQFARATKVKYHRLSALNNRNYHSSGGWKSEIKVLEGLILLRLVGIVCRASFLAFVCRQSSVCLVL